MVGAVVWATCCDTNGAGQLDILGNAIAAERDMTGRPRQDVRITKRFTVAFRPADYLALNELAVLDEISMAAVIRRAVANELRRKGLMR